MTGNKPLPLSKDSAWWEIPALSLYPFLRPLSVAMARSVTSFLSFQFCSRFEKETVFWGGVGWGWGGGGEGSVSSSELVCAEARVAGLARKV